MTYFPIHPLLHSQMSRRGFIAIGVGTFVVAGLPLAVRRGRSPRLVRRTIPVMGTIAEFAVVHHDVAVAERAIDAGIAELRWVETVMTRFDPSSDIGRANRSASRDAEAVTRETALVVTEALRWADATDGFYDPAIGSATQLWDVERRHEPPPLELVEQLANRNFFRDVEVDAGRHPRIVFHDAAAHLDLGAIAKGFGVDRAIAALRRHGITSGVVEAGGDLYALGRNVDGEPWRIGVQSPTDERALAGMIEVEDGAIATSGTYRRFFRYRGVRYHHLLDPRTAAPRVTPVQSYTIRADSCMHADVAATALYGRPVDDANRLLAGLAPGARVERIL